MISTIAKVYAATPAIEVQQKRAAIWRLLQNGLDAKINVIPDSFNKHEYLDEFVDAAHGETLEFERFEIDPESVAHMRNIDNLEFLMDSFGAVLDGLSLAMNVYHLYKELNVKTSYEAIKNISSIALFFTRNSTKHIYKKASFGAIAITGSVDAVLCGIETYGEFSEKDIDAAGFKAAETLGSACMAAAGFCYLAGAGSSATILGAPIGVSLIVAGTALSIVGGIGYVFANDTPVTIFIKESPWGTGGNYNQTPNNMETNIQKVLGYVKKQKGK
ncbi:MAG: hypothetical protein GF401_05270 [Chitinivibrionales bacterium]|nr:hypothetical protein [Chitinivibrionales bacterium]